MTREQERLARYMSELSEEHYSAGWLIGTEYALWQAIQDGKGSGGWRYLRPFQLARLRALSNACDGWIYFDSERGETYIPREEWERKFAGREVHDVE